MDTTLGIKLKRLASELPKHVLRPYLQVGVVLPALPVIDEAGKHSMMKFGGPRDTVIYVWRPSCIWCKRNLSNIQALALATKGSYHFVGLSTDSKWEKLSQSADPLPFPDFALSNSTLVSSLGFNSTPQTAVVDSRGVIEKVWPGAYDGKQQKEIEAFFKVKLPGVHPATPPE